MSRRLFSFAVAVVLLAGLNGCASMAKSIHNVSESMKPYGSKVADTPLLTVYHTTAKEDYEMPYRAGDMVANYYERKGLPVPPTQERTWGTGSWTVGGSHNHR